MLGVFEVGQAVLEDGGLGDGNQVEMIAGDFDVEDGLIMAVIDGDFAGDVVGIVGPWETDDVPVQCPHEQGRKGPIQVETTDLVEVKTAQGFIVLDAEEIEFAADAKDDDFGLFVVDDGLGVFVLWFSMYFLGESQNAMEDGLFLCLEVGFRVEHKLFLILLVHPIPMHPSVLGCEV